ncbi:aminotransferase class I/II-fold pyridoxal phosphate-dependent enzyme [Maribacter sp. 1_MG-2023]|uniref:aminotransferase class I/II-fold pyridoxal phosphate-dependent enzyme n=1 Tax=Maribacter sp. 1_MG-2023 TaxID=3062677 RepID=UPI0026E1F31F|nr:aminotransferase class I/II-fold pyridoxal phosphate-dependent enzyme [Maribacter sp. 1_MG-2023]MDO6472323.1 aminotransferase class I/II-fold pyridoxal phosphate-dependent enzyme [Maribacter sp. 1_MG-2023]
MFTIDEFPDRTIAISGKKYLYFGGTSYLGLQTDAEFQSLFINNIKKYGTAYSASRKSNIRISIFDEIDAHLAEIIGSEACVTMSSGYLAGQLVCNYFSKPNYQLYYAPNTHSALFRNQQEIFESWTELENAIKQHSNETPVLFLDSIDFHGDNYPQYNFLKKLPLKDIILVVDDSHGIGITGENGGGSFKFLQSLAPKELLVSCSLGKGFGIQSGAIFGSNNMINGLKNTQFFGGASPATPAALATIKDAHAIIATKRIQLNENMDLFLKNFSGKSLFVYAEGHPTFNFQNEILANYLEVNGIIVTNFRYPTENDSLMSRIVISASHINEDILKLCTILNSYTSNLQ